MCTTNGNNSNDEGDRAKRRQDNADPIDDVFGSTAKAGVADASLGLYRERGSQEAKLKLDGRDIDDLTLDICWNRSAGKWELGQGGLRADSVAGQIVAALEELGGQASVSELAAQTKRKVSNIARELAELLAQGRVERGRRCGRKVYYQLPGQGGFPLLGDGASAPDGDAARREGWDA